MCDKAPLSERADDAILHELLVRFPQYLDNRWIQVDGEHGYFGDGSNGENGIRTNSNVTFTAAVLATGASKFGIDPVNASILRERCRSGLRYLTESHMTGHGRCANGGKWGLEWQSAWWAAKLALAARLLWGELRAAERERIERLVVAEADRQLPRIVPTGLHIDTKAEEVAWDAEILASAIALLPHHPRRSAWYEKLIEFSANVFSTPQDRGSEKILDGRLIRDLVYTCNLHGDYSLENHGSYHFCYVASSLLSKAWCGYALQTAGDSIPEAIFHNVDNVWELAKKTFLRNRFAYISGQDWARYVYGEYFIVPALIFLDVFLSADRAQAVLRARLRQLLFEARSNTDGSCFGSRLTGGRYDGQYGKYETDCFCSVALAWELRHIGSTKRNRLTSALSAAENFQHVSPEGQFCFQRTSECFFSFSWMTLDTAIPNVSLVPLKDDSLAEWHAGNMIGTVKLLGRPITIGVRAMKADEGGIRVEGVCLVRSRRGRSLVEHHLKIRFDSLTATVNIESKFIARSRLLVALVTGVNLHVPNDIFNGKVRNLAYDGGFQTLETKSQTNRRIKCISRRAFDRFMSVIEKFMSRTQGLHSNWLNIDDTLGLVVRGRPEMVVRRFAGRRSAWKSLFIEQIESPNRRFAFFVRAGTTLLDSSIIVHVGTSERSRSIASGLAAGRSSSEM
jgi:hypothetical protein